MTRRTIHACVLGLLLGLSLAACDYFVSNETRIERAQKSIAAHQYRAAMIELSNVLAKDPDNVRARLLSAEVNLQWGDASAADFDLDRALARGAPRDEQTAVLQAKLRLLKGDAQGLLAEIDAHRLVLAEPALSLYRGDALLALQRTDAAEQAFKTALGYDARLTSAHIGLAAIYARSDVNRASAELDTIIAYDARSPEAWLARGSLYAARGQYREAERALSTAIANNRGDLPAAHAATAFGLLTEVRLALHDIDGASQASQQLTALAPKGVMARFLAARLSLLRHQYDDAVQTLYGLVNDAPDFAPGQRLLGVAQMAKGDLHQAEEQLQAYLARWPADASARKLLAQIELQLDQPEKARAAIAAGGEAQDSTTLLNLAAFDASTGHPEQAATSLEEAVKTDPSNLHARFALAQLAMRRGDAVGARVHLQEIRRADAKAIEPRLMLAALDLRNAETAEADAVLAEVLAAAPDRADARDAVGRLYFAAGRYDDALAHFRGALDRDPSQAAYWLDLSKAQFAVNQLPAAQVSAEQALALQGDLFAAMEMLVRIDIAAGRGDAAVARAVAWREKHPTAVLAHLLEGEAQFSNKRYAESARAYEAASRVSNSALLAARLYQARSRAQLPNATEPLTSWLKDHPREDFVRMLLADAYANSSKPRAAIEQYEILVAGNPRNAVALNNLAGLYDGAKDPRALSTAAKAFALAPRSPSIADTYGWIVLKSGDSREGLKVLGGAAAAAPDALDIQYHYAEALARSGDAAKATALLGKILTGDRPFDGRADAEALLKRLAPGGVRATSGRT